VPLKKKATLQVIENAAFLYCYVVEMGGVEPPSKLYESMTYRSTVAGKWHLYQFKPIFDHFLTNFLGSVPTLGIEPPSPNLASIRLPPLLSSVSIHFAYMVVVIPTFL